MECAKGASGQVLLIRTSDIFEHLNRHLFEHVHNFTKWFYNIQDKKSKTIKKLFHFSVIYSTAMNSISMEENQDT